jgi:hypothetical protein
MGSNRALKDGDVNTGAAKDRKGVLLISALAGVIGGLCCVTPVVLVLLGLASISVAADLGNVLYGNYRWVFRGVALTFALLALVTYFRRRGICSLDQARRERNRIINASLLVLLLGVGIYIFWTYIAVHYGGIAVGLPWAQYDEGWALPASAGVLGTALVLYFFLFRRSRKASDKTKGDLSELASKPAR